MDEPLLPPSLASRFRGARLLGEGAFGTVVYGEDAEGGGRPVAIKLLKPQEDPTGTWQARFEREALLTEALDSHYVVRALGHGVADDRPYLILEYVEGPTLEQLRLERGGRLPPEEALRIFVEVLFGLRAAHGQGVLHRDLKPENVLLRHGEEAVLTDFGLARDVASETLTATGTVMGTILYMAPELLAGQPATARSDVYAAVCLFGELVMGEVPLCGGNIGEIYDRRERGGFLGFRTEGVALPPQVDRLLTQALHENPAKRPVSAWEMSETLVEALERERMQDLLALVTIEDFGDTQPPVVLGSGDVDLDAPTMDGLPAPPVKPAPEETADSSMGLRVSAFQPPAAPPAAPEGGVGAYALAAAFLVLLGVSFGLGGEALSSAGPEVQIDPAEVRHQEAALATQAYLARLETPADPDRPSVMEAFTEIPRDASAEEAQNRRYLADLRLKNGLRDVREQVSGLDLRRGGAVLFGAVARLHSLELLVHATGPEALRGASLESPWASQLRRVMATWSLPRPRSDGKPWSEGGRTWRPLWKHSDVRRRLAEGWGRDGVMRGWKTSKERPDIRSQTLGGREFLYAGDDIDGMVDVFVPDRTLWVDYWPRVEFPLEMGAGEEDLVLAFDFENVPWCYLPHLDLVGRDHTVRVPVRPAYTDAARTDIKLRGMGSFPTAVRLARRVIPDGLHHVRLLNVGVEPLGNVSNNFSMHEVFRLASGALPPEAAFAVAPTEEVP